MDGWMDGGRLELERTVTREQGYTTIKPHDEKKVECSEEVKNCATQHAYAYSTYSAR